MLNEPIQPLLNGFAEIPPGFVPEKGKRWKKEQGRKEESLARKEIPLENSENEMIRFNPDNETRKLVRVDLSEGKFKTSAKNEEEAVKNVCNREGISPARIKEILDGHLYKIYEKQGSK